MFSAQYNSVSKDRSFVHNNKCNCVSVSLSRRENVTQNYFDSGFVMIVIGRFLYSKAKVVEKKACKFIYYAVEEITIPLTSGFV